MKCPKCGTDVPVGAMQCPGCGQKFVAAKRCPHCGSTIQASATVCPQCKQAVGGAPARSPFDSASKRQSSFRWWRIPIYILVLAIGFGAGSIFTRQSILNNVTSAFNQFASSTDDSQNFKQPTASASSLESSPASSEKAPSEVKTDSKYYFADNILVAEDVKIEITDWKVIPVGETGNEYGDVPVIAFWYNTTNLSGNENVSPMSSWIAMFTAVQDNNPDMINELQVASLPDATFLDTQTATIKKDGTVACACAYELSDTTTPVTLKGRKGMFGEDLGEQTFNISG